MIRLDEQFDKLKKNIDDVIAFMHFMNGHIEEKMSEDDLSLLRRVSVSPVPYNATIISLYGNIELFIDEVAETYIDLIYRLVNGYSHLPKKMREKHESVSGEFLTNPGRFLNYELSKEGIVKNLNECLQGRSQAILNKKMILRHSANLRSDQIIAFFSELGVDAFKNKLFLNNILLEYYANKNDISLESAREKIQSLMKDEELSKSLFFELDNLVEQRNQVAHSGRVDEKKGFEYIENITVPFLLVVAKTIIDILSNEIVLYAYENKKVEIFPEIYDVIDNRILLVNRGNNVFKIGDEISFYHNGIIGRAKISSIRVNDKDVKYIDNEAENNVSLAVESKVKKGWKYFICTYQNK